MPRIPRHRAAVLVLAGLMAGIVGGPDSLRAEDDPGLELLRDYLVSVQAIEARFRQEVIDRELRPVEVSSGRVILKRPGRFRWDYEQPYERLIVADGTRVWLYEADLEQVTVRRLDASLGETPAALLTGAADVLDRFSYQGSVADGRLTWVTLQPFAPDADFETIRLAFADKQIVQLELADRLGQTTRLYLSDIDTDPDIAPGAFTFEPPAGVDVIGETEL